MCLHVLAPAYPHNHWYWEKQWYIRSGSSSWTPTIVVRTCRGKHVGGNVGAVHLHLLALALRKLTANFQRGGDTLHQVYGQIILKHITISSNMCELSEPPMYLAP